MGRRRVAISTDGGDEVGMLLAAACLAHCLLAPALAAAWPLIGVPLAQASGVHQILAAATVLLSLAMLLPGYRQHRRAGIVAVGAVGTLLLLIGATQAGLNCCSTVLAWVQGTLPLADVTWQEWLGFAATPIGCVAVGLAHWRNRCALAAADLCCATET